MDILLAYVSMNGTVIDVINNSTIHRWKTQKFSALHGSRWKHKIICKYVSKYIYKVTNFFKYLENSNLNVKV
jgi:hypothetical protein